MRRFVLDLARGASLAVVAGLAALLVARFALERLQVLSLLLAVAMVAMLLGAWCLHLRADGFFGTRRPVRDADPPREPAATFAVYGEGILARDGGKSWTPQEVLRALLWSALLLGAASLVFHSRAGIGPA